MSNNPIQPPAGAVAAPVEELQPPYMEDLDIDAIGTNETKVMILGWIDHLEPRSVVGSRTGKHDVRKFVLNNGGNRRMQCNIWTDAAIRKFQNVLEKKNIIIIENANTKELFAPARKADPTLFRFEVNISKTTTIEKIGVHTPRSRIDDNLESATLVDFNSIKYAQGFVCLEGWIKQQFFIYSPSNTYERVNFGSGTLTDGSNKVDVSVTDSSGDMSHLVPGLKVKAYGITTGEEGDILQLRCRDFERIVPIENAPMMSRQQLLKGTRSARKRKLSDDKSQDPPSSQGPSTIQGSLSSQGPSLSQSSGENGHETTSNADIEKNEGEQAANNEGNDAGIAQNVQEGEIEPESKKSKSNEDPK